VADSHEPIDSLIVFSQQFSAHTNDVQGQCYGTAHLPCVAEDSVGHSGLINSLT
jgi:hypothetical protein